MTAYLPIHTNPASNRVSIWRLKSTAQLRAWPLFQKQQERIKADEKQQLFC